ncbi:MAG TPA: hypothetical protein VFW07_01505 [Parafilimonas sp.]|nr:hypothetical protein [Parafilimonas sp.]
MFDQLLSLVKENSETDIIGNDAIPNQRNDEAVELATQSISETFRNALQSGNTADVMQMFNNGGNVSSLPLTQNIQGNFIDNLMQKFGLSNAQAGGIASSLIPMVLGKLVNRTNDPNDNNFNISSILGGLGGSGFDVSSVLSQFGLGSSHQNGNNQESGGILDSLKNILGK